MTSTSTPPAGRGILDTALWRWLWVGLLAYAVAIFAQYGVIRGGAISFGASPATSTLVPPLLLLGPMIAAAVIVTWGTHVRGAARLLGLRILPTDLLIGTGLGALLRGGTALVTLALLGTTGFGGQVIIGDVDVWFFVRTLVFPILVTPFVEELYFRGILQRSIVAGLRRLLPGRMAVVVGVASTALMFTALHAVTALNGLLALNSALILFTLGAVTGILAVLTRRIGLSILVHIAFNAVAVWLTWPL